MHSGFCFVLNQCRDGLCHAASMILVPKPETDPRLCAAKAQSPNNWTTRKFPKSIKNKQTNKLNFKLTAELSKDSETFRLPRHVQSLPHDQSPQEWYTSYS